MNVDDLWIPVDHVHDGGESRTSGSGNCKECIEEKKQYRGLKRNKKTICEHHPTCNTWNSQGTACAMCSAESDLVRAAKSSDKRKCLVSSLTIEYVRSVNGSSYCYNCGNGPLCCIPEIPWDHRQLSLDRIDNSRPHDSDPQQTVASCLQCNLWRNNWTLEKFAEVQDHTAKIITEGFPNDLTYPPISKTLFKVGKKKASKAQMTRYVEGKQCSIKLSEFVMENGSLYVQSYLEYPEYFVHNKVSNSSKKGSVYEYNISVEEFIDMYDSQKGRCSLCGMFLHTDISMDRTIPSSAYTKTSVTLMHRNCNCGKGPWSIQTIYDIAIRRQMNVAARRGLFARSPQMKTAPS